MQGLYWIASYPRSGNTWLRLLLDSYLHGGAAVDINRISPSGLMYSRAFADDVLGIDTADLLPAEILALRPQVMRAIRDRHADPVMLKTHDMRHRLADGQWTLPADVTLGGVYLVRDPRDVVLSLARFLSCPLDQAITIMATAGQQRATSHDQQATYLVNLWGSWSENVGSWLTVDPFPVHLVRYEDLRARPHHMMAGILRAFDLPVDQDRIAAAVAATALETLHQQEQQRGFIEYAGPGRFFGRGAVAGWRQVLTPAQVGRIRDQHGEVMARLGYDDR